MLISSWSRAFENAHNTQVPKSKAENVSSVTYFSVINHEVAKITTWRANSARIGFTYKRTETKKENCKKSTKKDCQQCRVSPPATPSSKSSRFTTNNWNNDQHKILLFLSTFGDFYIILFFNFKQTKQQETTRNFLFHLCFNSTWKNIF